MCYHYAHVVAGSVLTSPTGPVIFREGITVPLKTDKAEFKLENNSDVENHILAGIWVTKPGTKLREGLTVAAADIFRTCYLTIRKDAEVVLDELYLEHILAANNEGRPFIVSLPGAITMSRSLLVVQNPAGIIPDTAIQIQVDYLKRP